jgi:hypothetical protein
VVKHRQLARQVGAFGAIAIKSSTDFDDMIFLMGSTFIFASWVCEADDKGNLHGHLVKALEAHEDLALPTGLAEDLAEIFSGLTMPESTRAPTTTNLDLVFGSDSSLGSNPGSFGNELSSFLIGLRNAASTLQEINSNLLQVSSKKLGHFPTELNNMAKTYQNSLRGLTRRIQKLHLIGAQEGLMLTVTLEDCLVYWPSTYPLNSNVQLIEEAITLPYQKGSTLRDANTTTKILSDYSKASMVPGQEAFMIRRPLPMPPTMPDVRSSDESEANISPNVPEYDGESEGQQRTREKKNRLKEGRRRRAR